MLKHIPLLLLFLSITSSGFGQTMPKNSIYTEVQINLNNGERWMITAEMRKELDKIFKVIDARETTYKTSGKRLAKKLMGMTEDLIDVCSFEGQGHTEFHKWLNPFWDLLEMLRDELFKEDEQEIWKDIQYARQLCDVYFE